jgi:citrate lyase subunit beta/citryl-CoA lyase
MIFNRLIAPIMISMDNDKHVSKIWELNSESVILNLEDGVLDKNRALDNLRKFLMLPRIDNRILIVRTNPIFEGGLEEILTLNNLKPNAFRIPKIRNLNEIYTVLSITEKNSIEIHLSIETREAWTQLQNLKIDQRITTFYLGILDLVADLNLNSNIINPNNSTIIYILSHFLVTTRAIGVLPVAPVFQEYKNIELFESWLKLEKELGFTAKGSISPTQSKRICEIFKISNDEVEKAREIIKIFEKLIEDRNNNIFVETIKHEKYGFIDEPIYKLAKQILKNIEENLN